MNSCDPPGKYCIEVALFAEKRKSVIKKPHWLVFIKATLDLLPTVHGILIFTKNKRNLLVDTLGLRAA